jgi:hypothetical protein
MAAIPAGGFNIHPGFGAPFDDHASLALTA